MDGSGRGEPIRAWRHPRARRAPDARPARRVEPVQVRHARGGVRDDHVRENAVGVSNLGAVETADETRDDARLAVRPARAVPEPRVGTPRVDVGTRVGIPTRVVFAGASGPVVEVGGEEGRLGRRVGVAFDNVRAHRHVAAGDESRRRRRDASVDHQLEHGVRGRTGRGRRPRGRRPLVPGVVFNLIPVRVPLIPVRVPILVPVRVPAEGERVRPLDRLDAALAHGREERSTADDVHEVHALCSERGWVVSAFGGGDGCAFLRLEVLGPTRAGEDSLDVELGPAEDAREGGVQLTTERGARNERVDGAAVVAEHLGVAEQGGPGVVLVFRGFGCPRARGEAPGGGAKPTAGALGVVQRAPTLARKNLVRRDGADERVGARVRLVRVAARQRVGMQPLRRATKAIFDLRIRGVGRHAKYRVQTPRLGVRVTLRGACEPARGARAGRARARPHAGEDVPLARSEGDGEVFRGVSHDESARVAETHRRILGRGNPRRARAMTPEEHARALRARGLAFVHRTLDPTARDPSALRTPGSSWRSKMANADVGAFYGTPDVARRRATPEHYRVDGAPTLGSPAFADVTVEPLARSPTTLERKNPPSAAAWSLASPVAMATLDLSRDPSSPAIFASASPPSVSPSTSAAAREMSAAAVSAAVMGATAVAEAVMRADVMRADVMRADVMRADVRAGRPGRTSAGTNAIAKTGTSRLEPGTLAGPIGTVPTVENGTQTPSRVENGTQTADAAVAPPPNPDSLGAPRAATESRVLFTAVRLERERRELRDRVALLTQREEALARREAGVRAARGEVAEAISFALDAEKFGESRASLANQTLALDRAKTAKDLERLRAACAATEARAAKREAEIRRLEEDAATARDDAARTREDAKIASAELRETQAATARAEARREAAERRAEEAVCRAEATRGEAERAREVAARNLRELRAEAESAALRKREAELAADAAKAEAERVKAEMAEAERVKAEMIKEVDEAKTAEVERAKTAEVERAKGAEVENAKGAEVENAKGAEVENAKPEECASERASECAEECAEERAEERASECASERLASSPRATPPPPPSPRRPASLADVRRAGLAEARAVDLRRARAALDADRAAFESSAKARSDAIEAELAAAATATAAVRSAEASVALQTEALEASKRAWATTRAEQNAALEDARAGWAATEAALLEAAEAKVEAIEARARGAMDDAARRVAAADARVATAREVAAALEAGRAELDREAASLKAREASSASLEASLRVAAAESTAAARRVAADAETHLRRRAADLTRLGDERAARLADAEAAAEALMRTARRREAEAEARERNARAAEEAAKRARTDAEEERSRVEALAARLETKYAEDRAALEEGWREVDAASKRRIA